MYSQFFILDSWFSQKSKSQLFQGYSNYNCIQFVIQYVYQCMLSSLISFNFKTCFDSWAFESYNTICSEGNVKWICPKSKYSKMRCSDVNQVEITYLSKVSNVTNAYRYKPHNICPVEIWEQIHKELGQELQLSRKFVETRSTSTNNNLTKAPSKHFL